MKRTVEVMNERFKKILVFSMILFFLSLFVINTVSSMTMEEIYETPQCAYGSFDTWFSTDGYTWRQATVEGIELKRGEPFFIKTIMTTSRPFVRVGLLFTEPGEYNSNGSTFDIIDEGLCMFEAYLFGVIEKPLSSFERIWRFQVKQDTTWVQATAPLNVFVQFDWLDDMNKWRSDEISFTIMSATISSESYTLVEDSLFENYTTVSNSVFTTELFILFLLLTFFVRYKRKRLN